ncbi:MAG: helix-turn-helix domain-containing protein [Granulosicoccus sp.]
MAIESTKNIKNKSVVQKSSTARLRKAKSGSSKTQTTKTSPTAIECCVNEELERYFEMLDGQAPADLYRMVIRQAESALLRSVMNECGGNQSKAATWLGISRGNLRNKLADMEIH